MANLEDFWNYGLGDAGKNIYGHDFYPDPMYEMALNGLEQFYQYLDDTGIQVLQSNYTDKCTLLGVILQVASGIASVDLPTDLRDITYDITNFELSLEHLGQTGLDLVGLLPVIGGVKNLKYADEVAEVVTTVSKRVNKAERGKKNN